MHSIVKSLFMLIAALLLCLNVRQAYADTPYDTMGMVFANADAGWETMILHGNDYEKYHHGFSTTLSAGINVFCFLGLQIEQDLGFIELQRAEGSPKKELLFKGATLVTWPLFSPTLGDVSSSLPNLMVHIKLGLGAMYMQTPKGVSKSVQSWFAFRPTIAVIWLSDTYGHKAFGGGIEFGYTLACSDSNVFDHRKLVHLLNLKAKFIVSF